MGRVWRAADEILDRPVAIKEMRIDGLDAEDTRTRRERTLREARATARIDHPNVVRVYDVVDEGERLWIVMELVAGRSLERLLVEEGPLSPSQTARIGLGLVAALRQVHERGVLHRDIKPGNVLVETGARRVVLTDFGIAAIQDAKALTMVGMLVGSPDYMAPERISGRPQGPPSDIWSLGATLCAALGGRSPFSRDTTLATLHAVLYEEPELPASSGPLTAILAALLEKDPDTRPGLPDLETALHPIAFPTPTPTVRVGTPEDPPGDTGHPKPTTPQENGTPTAAPPGAPAPGMGEPWGATGQPGVSVVGAGEPRGEAGRPETVVSAEPGQPAAEPLGSGRPGASAVGAGEPRGEAGRPETVVSAEPGQPAAAPPETGRPSTSAGADWPAAASTVRAGEPETSVSSGPGPDPAAPVGMGKPEASAPSVGPEWPEAAAPEGAGESQTAASVETTEPDAAEPPPTGWPEPTAPATPELTAPAPEASALAPEPMASTPEPTTFEPEPSASAPELTAPAPEASAFAPESMASALEPTTFEPEPSASAPELTAPAPEASAFAPELMASAPEPTTFGPEPSVPAPDPSALAPEVSPPASDPRRPAPPEPADTPPADTPPTEAPRAAEPPEDPRPTRDFGRRAIPRTLNASTEAASEARSEVRSEAPAPNPLGSASSTTGVSLIRAEPGMETRARAEAETKPAAVLNAEAETKHRPAPTRAATPGHSQAATSGHSRAAAPGPSRTATPTPDSHPMPPGELPGPAVPTPTPHPPHPRRTRVLAAVAMVTVGAVVAVVLVLNSGSPDDSKAGGTSSSPAQNSPSPTVEGTSRPQSLPPGARTEAGGFAWVTPEGWRRDVKTGAEVHYTSPDGKQELVAKSSLARGDLMETWETSEQNAHQGQAYRKIRLEETTFRGYPAVEWEYTFTLKGVPWHARLLGFNEKGKSYQINTWYQPDVETQALRTYEEVKDSFTIL
ncbi:hypothetical protein BN159_5662 [Streptomyces davaonensis JCM 4913]|uniref:non-specific serine/threonine protein kinase n=1 Tax=Streptomyces davaonensis (strain DSM 101723 / JCM 4913 / KCC S-0913 / 768) TaxID=1214101 RepID=K4R172_STRDJ|nr:hypothetical protein BN159_5662 [Streptomyces davaonensis JCM 4913]